MALRLIAEKMTLHETYTQPVRGHSTPTTPTTNNTTHCCTDSVETIKNAKVFNKHQVSSFIQVFRQVWNNFAIKIQIAVFCNNFQLRERPGQTGQR